MWAVVEFWVFYKFFEYKLGLQENCGSSPSYDSNTVNLFTWSVYVLQESPCTKKMSFNYYKTSVPLIKWKLVSKKLWIFFFLRPFLMPTALQTCSFWKCFQILLAQSIPSVGFTWGSIFDRDLLTGTLGLMRELGISGILGFGSLADLGLQSWV